MVGVRKSLSLGILTLTSRVQMSEFSSQGISDRTGLGEANIMQKSHYVSALSWRRQAPEKEIYRRKSKSIQSRTEE